MKTFKFWSEATYTIKIGAGTEQIKVLAGSNVSKQDASRVTATKAKEIEQRIAERKPKDEYDAAIKEHVAEQIDDRNVITVCRYGAKILNTTEYTVLDLDDYPFDFLDIFKSFKGMSKKQRIVAKFEQKLKQHPILGRDFRIYETSKGIRVIGKQYLDPSQKKNASLMRKLNVDWLYIQLSSKQKCFRARLTPKPYRMKMKTIRINSPLICETQTYLEWAGEYGKMSEGYSVLRLVKTLGEDFSRDRAIDQHDRMCNIFSDNKLA